MVHRLWLLFIFYFLLISHVVYAQHCTNLIFGTLRDAKDKSVLAYASISVIETGETMITDADGHYHFNKLCSGSYTLSVSYVGYKPKKVIVKLEGKKEQDILLQLNISELSSVQVSAAKPERKPIQIMQNLEGTELEMTRGESLGEALKSVSGINAVQTGPNISKPMIQGMYGNRIVISNAGVRQEGQQWGSEHAPEIDPFIASSISIIKGAASVQYGADAIGGVILVKPAIFNYTSGTGGILNFAAMSNNGLGALSLQLEGSPDRNNYFSWRIQGTTRFAGNSKTANYYLKNTGLREYNGTLSFGYVNKRWSADMYFSSFNTQLGIFTGSNVGSTDDRNNAINRNEPLPIYQSNLNYSIDRPYQLVNHHLAKFKASLQFPHKGSLNFQYSFQQNYREEYDIVRGSSTDKYQYQFDLNTHITDIYFEHQPIGKLAGRAGITGSFQQNYYDGAYLIPYFKSYNAAAYLIERWRKNKFEIEGGIRFDRKFMQVIKRINPRNNNSPLEYPTFNFNQITGTLGTSYHFSKSYALTTTIAKGWRPPNINELFIDGVHQGNAAFERGNRNLKDESSINLSIGVNRQIGKITGDISLYHNIIDNYIYLQPQLDEMGKPIFEITQRGGFLAFQYDQLNARFTGADLQLNYLLTPNLKVTGKYATVRAYEKATNQHLIYIPADKFTGAINYQLPKLKWYKSTTVDLSFTHVDRQSKVNDSQDFAPAPAGYSLLDAAINTSLLVNNHQWNISISMNNLLNKEYRDYLNRFRYYAADIGRNIILRLQIPFGKINKLL